MQKASATTTIDADAATVFAAVSDITRMGEWSPECVGGEWAPGSDQAAVGARFIGHNKVSLHKWSTESEITEFVPGEVFEFVSEGQTTWRYEFQSVGDQTVVTESFTNPSVGGVRGFIYDSVLRRDRAMLKGMQKTLARLKDALES